MPAEDKTFSGSYSPDGTTKQLVSELIPSDQSWYVDSLFVSSDGTGSALSHVIDVAVGPSGAIDDVDQFPNLPRGVRTTLDLSDNKSTASATVGEYGGAGEEVRVETGAESDSATVYYTLLARRVV